MVQISRSTTQAPTPALEKVPAAAQRMGCSISGVYREIRAKRLILVKLGARSSAVSSASVDEWILARIAAATQNNTNEKNGSAA